MHLIDRCNKLAADYQNYILTPLYILGGLILLSDVLVRFSYMPYPPSGPSNGFYSQPFLNRSSLDALEAAIGTIYVCKGLARYREAAQSLWKLFDARKIACNKTIDDKIMPQQAAVFVQKKYKAEKVILNYDSGH